MITDIWTIARKEWLEMLTAQGSLRGGLTRLALMAAVFGILLPVQAGRAWLESPASLAAWVWVPLLLTGTMTADAFAGERERHTLETLLASRMPNRPIFLGKVLTAISYGWGIVLASIILGLVSVNVVHGGGQLLLYPPLILTAAILLGLLVSGLAASLGVLISLRAATVRQAQWTISLATMGIFVIPFGVAMGLPRLWPSAAASATAFLTGASPSLLLAGVLAVLAAIDGALLVAGLARFQRARLIF